MGEPGAAAPEDPWLPEDSGAGGEVGASDVRSHGGGLEVVRRGRQQVAVRVADWRADHHQRRELLRGPNLEQDPRLRLNICEQDRIQVAPWSRALCGSYSPEVMWQPGVSMIISLSRLAASVFLQSGMRKVSIP